MGSSNKTSTQTTSQTRNPWSPTQAPLEGIVNQAAALGSNPANFTPTFSNWTQQGIQGIANAANDPSRAFQTLDTVVPGSTAGFTTGLGNLTNVANGTYLNNNPYLDAVIGNTTTGVADKVNSQFSAAGRYGSGAHTATLAKEIGNLDASMRLSNYNTERGNQNAASSTLYGGGFTGAGMAGAYDAAALQPAMLSLQAGQLQDQIDNAQRTAPMNAVQWQAGITNPIASLGGTSEGTSTSTQPVDKFGQILGGVGMGLGLLTAPMTGGASLFGSLGAPSMLGSLTGMAPTVANPSWPAY